MVGDYGWLINFDLLKCHSLIAKFQLIQCNSEILPKVAYGSMSYMQATIS